MQMDNTYDKTIGYSPLEDVDEEKMLQVVKVNKRIIDGYYVSASNDLVLVAGAGQGQEAVLIGQEYRLRTFGVDLHIKNISSPETREYVFFQRQDISSLAFRDRTFSLIYSYHVLEHVDDQFAVLRELERVLSPGGVLFIGFPNKNRFFSYIGTSQTATFLDKIRWNLRDYGYRLMGKFENKHGAHAGFAEKEFLLIAAQFFPAVYSVRDQYMLYKYSKHKNLINFVIKMGLNEFVFPSNYYVCIKH
jgi:SAM-dependent methyltransferase